MPVRKSQFFPKTPKNAQNHLWPQMSQAGIFRKKIGIRSPKFWNAPHWWPNDHSELLDTLESLNLCVDIIGIGVEASTEKSIFPENSQKTPKIIHDPGWAELWFFEEKLEFEARNFKKYRTDGQMITRSF